MTPQDIQDIKTIAEEVKNMVTTFDLKPNRRNWSAAYELFYDVDMSMRAILEIINGPSGTVERMI